MTVLHRWVWIFFFGVSSFNFSPVQMHPPLSPTTWKFSFNARKKCGWHVHARVVWSCLAKIKSSMNIWPFSQNEVNYYFIWQERRSSDPDQVSGYLLVSEQIIFRFQVQIRWVIFQKLPYTEENLQLCLVSVIYFSFEHSLPNFGRVKLQSRLPSI